MRALLFAAALTAAAAASPAPSYCPKPARSTSTVRAFQKATGFPNGRPGYVVDHKIPLCACGPDRTTNMAWQRLDSSRMKDVYEKQLCAELRKQTAPAPR